MIDITFSKRKTIRSRHQKEYRRLDKDIINESINTDNIFFVCLFVQIILNKIYSICYYYYYILILKYQKIVCFITDSFISMNNFLSLYQINPMIKNHIFKEFCDIFYYLCNITLYPSNNDNDNNNNSSNNLSHSHYGQLLIYH